MSDHIPIEIKGEIMKRFPVKTLIQFRSVSKAWKSLIDSSHFITHYGSPDTHLLVRSDIYVGADVERKYVSIVDDDSFPRQRVSLTLPPLINRFQLHRIVGSSHGLLCFYADFRDAPFAGAHMAALWNPSIRKAIAVDVPNVADVKGIYRTVLGFGVCRETTDPKIVKITHIYNWNDMGSIPDTIPWQVEVFTLSTKAWRSPNSNLPRKSIEFGCSQEVIDGFLYWLAIDRINMDGGFNTYNLIISFDLTSEEFKEINLPHSLAHLDYLYLSKLRESVVVLEHDFDEMICIVWIMEGGVPNTFKKLFTIDVDVGIELTVLEFRKSGEPIFDYGYIQYDALSLVYDPYSKHFNHVENLEINGRGSYDAYAYMETLLLLDQPDFTIYNTGESYIQMQRGINQ